MTSQSKNDNNQLNNHGSIKKDGTEWFVETTKELNLKSDEILYSHGLNANYFDRIGIDEMMDFELAIKLIESVAKESGRTIVVF